ncbi:MAG: hypothetical protein AABZ31_01600, partial [Bdellovibrionota bacterium]
MKKIKLIFAFCILAFLISCDHGTITGNPLISLTFNGSSQDATIARLDIWQRLYNAFIPTAVAAPSTIVDSGGRTVLLDEFWTTIGEVEFKFFETATADEVDGDSVELTGPYSSNILVTTADPVGSVRIGLKAVRRIKVKLMRTDSLPAGAPVDFLNKSLLISGTVNGVPFTLTSEDEAVVEVAGPNAVSVPNGSSLLLQLQIANIFKKINLADITVPTN